MRFAAVATKVEDSCINPAQSGGKARWCGIPTTGPTELIQPCIDLLEEFHLRLAADLKRPREIAVV